MLRPKQQKIVEWLTERAPQLADVYMGAIHLHLLLKIIANSLYGTFAELNKCEYGKNNAQQLGVFSGEIKFTQPTCVVEREGPWHFPPAAALITAGGRLMLAILQAMVEEKKGSYLLTDTADR